MQQKRIHASPFTTSGPAADGNQTTNPVIYIGLTDLGGKFTGQWFFAAKNSKAEMLAGALSAISLGKTVPVVLDPPDVNGSPYTQYYRFYIVCLS